MALKAEQRKLLLEMDLPASNQVRQQLNDYLKRTALTESDFARRINYSKAAVAQFLGGRYHAISSNDRPIRAAITQFIAAHPVAVFAGFAGDKLYETENVKILREIFYKALDNRRAYFVAGDPGTQKSFVLEHLIAELNRTEASKNGHGRRAYYIYCGGTQQTLTPSRLMRRVSEACGSIVCGDVERVLRNLRFDFGARKVLLVFDEAQHLNLDCMEVVRELLDRPPYCGLLFAGSHEFQRAFVRDAVHLEQWNSRFHAGKSLPGMSAGEAEGAIRQELAGAKNLDKVAATILKKARKAHFGGQGEYISARVVFETIAELKAGA